MTDKAGALRGRTAVVTGASRGLGACIAAALADAGAEVTLLARSADGVATVAERIGSAARGMQCDVADPTSVRRAFEAIAERHTRIDLLVNNAGAAGPHTLEELSDEELCSEIGVNFAGPLLCIRSALPMLRRAGHSDVINISSIAVTEPFPTMWLYTAAKSALEHASLGLVDELRPDGVRVTVLRTGSLAKSGFQDSWAVDRRQRALDIARDAGRHRFAGATPVDPDVIAELVVKLAALPPQVRIGTIDVRPS